MSWRGVVQSASGRGVLAVSNGGDDLQLAGGRGWDGVCGQPRWDTACQYAGTGVERWRVDPAHDRYVAEDFALVHSMGIRTVRESAQWHLIDRDGALDFATLAPVAEAARAAGVQVLWTLCHYGWPEDLDLFSDELVARFAASQ